MIATIKVDLPQGYRISQVIALSDKERFPMSLQIIGPVVFSGSIAETRKRKGRKPKRRRRE